MSKDKAAFEVNLGPTGRLSRVVYDGKDIGHQIDRIWISTGVDSTTKVEIRFIAATVKGSVEGDFRTWTDGEDVEEEE